MKNLDLNLGVDYNSPNSLDHLSPRAFFIASSLVTLLSSALGTYIGSKLGHPIYGAAIGFILPMQGFEAASEERYYRALERTKSLEKTAVSSGKSL